MIGWSGRDIEPASQSRSRYALQLEELFQALERKICMSDQITNLLRCLSIYTDLNPGLAHEGLRCYRGFEQAFHQSCLAHLLRTCWQQGQDAFACWWGCCLCPTVGPPSRRGS